MANAFDRALGIVNVALRDRQSKAAYIHGSFGSGKSHFMGLLSLLLRGDEDAWRVKELHALRPKYEFVGKKKLVELHFHMVDKKGIEDAIFDQHLRFVREHHASADLPGLFADESLFTDAARMLTELGEEKFFARMNAQGPAAAGWGKRAQAWDTGRFESAAASTDIAERAQLFSALVKSWFGSFAEQSDRYLDLDTGLGVMSRHAKELGYDGVVLFLDELILWLWSPASRPEVLHESAARIPVSKFQACLPEPLMADLLAEKLLDVEGAQRAVGVPQPSNGGAGSLRPLVVRLRVESDFRTPAIELAIAARWPELPDKLTVRELEVIAHMLIPFILERKDDGEVARPIIDRAQATARDGSDSASFDDVPAELLFSAFYYAVRGSRGLNDYAKDGDEYHLGALAICCAIVRRLRERPGEVALRVETGPPEGVGRSS